MLGVVLRDVELRTGARKIEIECLGRIFRSRYSSFLKSSSRPCISYSAERKPTR
jgi:hypothetical protein